MSSTGITFWKWILNLPNYLERDDHRTGTNSQLIRDVPADSSPGGHTRAAPQHPMPAWIWSTLDRSPPEGSTAKLTLDVPIRVPHSSVHHFFLSDRQSLSLRSHLPAWHVALFHLLKYVFPVSCPALPEPQSSNHRIIGTCISGKEPHGLL